MRATRPRRFPVGVLVAVAIGGAAGTLVRAWVSVEVSARTDSFPWGTFAVNLAGSLVLGFVIAAALAHSIPTRYVRPLLGTGFCGALTTFSTFVVETDLLIRAGRIATAGGYVSASVIGGLAATWLGAASARLLWR